MTTGGPVNRVRIPFVEAMSTEAKTRHALEALGSNAARDSRYDGCKAQRESSERTSTKSLLVQLASKRWIVPLAASLLFVGGFVLLALAMRDDFQIDEVYCLSLAQQMHQAGDVLSIRDYANHPLSTLFMFLIGNTEHWILYRLLSIFSAVGTLIAMGWLGFRSGVARGLIALGLTAFSFPLVIYASEARGYAPAVFFAILAYVPSDHLRRTFSIGPPVLFAVFCALGFLSHFIFVYVYLGLWAWTAGELLEEEKPWRSAAIRRAALIHAVPTAVMFAVYLCMLRGAMVAGGPIYPAWMVVTSSLSLGIGVWTMGPWGLGTAAITLTVLAIGVIRLRRAGSPDWLFQIVVLLVAPFLVFIINRPVYLYFRYYLVCYPFFFLLLADVVAAACRRGGATRLAAAAVLAVYVGGSASALSELLRVKRANYYAATLYMASHTAGPAMVVMSDNDFKNKTLLSFYRRYLKALGKELEYHDHGDWPNGGPEWVILYRDPEESPPADRLNIRGIPFALSRCYPSIGISGFAWFLFHKEVSGLHSGGSI